MDSHGENSVPPLCRTRPTRAHGLTKLLLSAFIIYHTACVVILPNGSSLIGRRLSRYFLSYANIFGFNTVWQFFSPAPAATSYLEYSFDFSIDDEGLSDDSRHAIRSYPPRRPAGQPWDDFFTRRLYAMRFFMVVPGALEQNFIPFLCRQEKTATGVSIHQTFERVPSIEKAMGDSFSEIAEREDLPSQHFSCPQPNGETVQ